jgi:hypothetical protein
MIYLQLNFLIYFILSLGDFSVSSIEDISKKNDSKKPNLILILVDDLGYADLGLHGSKQIPTPNIDQLGKEGIIFKSAYVSSSVCAPSRACLCPQKI